MFVGATPRVAADSNYACNHVFSPMYEYGYWGRYTLASWYPVNGTIPKHVELANWKSLPGLQLLVILRNGISLM